MTKRDLKAHVKSTSKELTSSQFDSWVDLICKDGSRLTLSPVYMEEIEDKKVYLVIYHKHVNIIFEETDILTCDSGEIEGTDSSIILTS